MKNMDPWIHGSAAGAAAGAAASAATVFTFYVIIGEALHASIYLHDRYIQWQQKQQHQQQL